jgi:hypothetical protein
MCSIEGINELGSEMNSTVGRLTLDAPATYRICVQGRLSASSSDYFQGLRIEEATDGNAYPRSVLEGTLIDQAALTGVLSSLVDWGFPLLSVECVEQRRDGRLHRPRA